MTLFDIATIFKEQLIDKFYIINTPTNILYVRTFPKNLLHLTGLQRTKEFRHINHIKFYNDCLSQVYQKDILKYTYSNIKERNIVDMKVSNFNKIQSAITNAKQLYYIKDKNDVASNAISVGFLINNKNKFLTLVFKIDKETGFCVPVSIQLDQNQNYGVIPKAYKSEKITCVQALDYTSQIVKNIIKNSR